MLDKDLTDEQRQMMQALKVESGVRPKP